MICCQYKNHSTGSRIKIGLTKGAVCLITSDRREDLLRRKDYIYTIYKGRFKFARPHCHFASWIVSAGELSNTR